MSAPRRDDHKLFLPFYLLLFTDVPFLVTFPPPRSILLVVQLTLSMVRFWQSSHRTARFSIIDMLSRAFLDLLFVMELLAFAGRFLYDSGLRWDMAGLLLPDYCTE